MSKPANEIGLSLSGGGYRATAFHLGTLRKLQSLGILQKVDVISTISGGSITGAYYALHKDDFDYFSSSLYDKLLHNNVISKVIWSRTFLQAILFCVFFLGAAVYFLLKGPAWVAPLVLLVWLILLGLFQFRIFPVSRRIERVYDQFFYHKKTLGDLPENPKLVIGSTNMQTARPFTFSRNWMQDATYQFMQPAITFKAKDFPVSRAVMASSCVPFAFSPIPMAKRFFTDPEDFKRVKPVLVDGGVYDNQGIHKLIQEGRYSCATVITSDAGGASGFMNSSFRNVLSLLLSTVDVFMSRIKKVQLAKDVFENAKSANRQVAYLSLAWDSENCIPGFIENLEDGRITQEVIAAHGLHAGWVENPKAHHAEITQYLKLRTGYADILLPSVEDKNTARAVGTNLTSLSQKKLDCLIAQAEALTEIQVRLYCPTLFN